MGEARLKIRDFLKRIQGEYHIEKAILFGSRARGNNLKDSDIDLILVSDSFEGIPFPDRPSKLYRFWKGGLPLELLCYTTKEFEAKRKRIGLLRNALQEGIELDLTLR